MSHAAHRDQVEAEAEPAGLYVHLPCCRSRCRYCDFYAVVAEPPEELVEALSQEARLAGRGYGTFDSLYLGGGTPSVLPPRQLGALIAGLRRRVAVAPDSELTVELNPDDVDEALLEALGEAGVSRLSLGIQSFEDQALAWLGRRHDASRACAALERVQRAGFAELGMDLIFGWPGQTPGRWVSDLEHALSFQPIHLSCYELTLEPGTALHRDVEAGREPRWSDSEHNRELYLASAETLRGRGWDHYEVSNFARTPRHRSRHNAKYWRHVNYLGLGPSAHSLRGRRRRWNHADLSGYLCAAQRAEPPPHGGEILDARAWRLEAVMLGLRTADGVSLSTLGDVPGAEETINALVAEGRVERSGGQLRPTLKGFLVADSLPLRFNL
jgi:oxygen-independent coproporphyrinogen-3 oxidase